MRIDLDTELRKLNFTFAAKPLLIGGLAMEYYELRESGADIDLVISATDHEKLRKKYPADVKDLYGDIGICVYDFEIWNQICRFKYENLVQNAIEKEHYFVISLEKLILLKTIAINIEKSFKLSLPFTITFIRRHSSIRQILK